MNNGKDTGTGADAPLTPERIGLDMSRVTVHRYRSCTVFIGREPVDGVPRWHLSMTHPTRYPSWDEINTARMRWIPQDVTMALLLPGEPEYVNVHPRCFHLWELRPGTVG